VPTGDFPSNPLHKPGYRLEFHDEFDGATLDTTKWLPFYLPQWSSRAQSAPRYVMKNSQLILQITQDQLPWCPEFDGGVRCSSLQTGVFAGPVGSAIGQHRFNKACVVREAQTNARTYTPQYGYFELRAKGLRTSGSLAALWMIGYEDTPERSAEITVCELAGTRTSPTRSSIRYGVHPFADPAITDEFYEDPFDIDTAQFHLYAVEWTPAHIDYYLDNVKIRTIDQSPAYPMQFMLNLYELPFVGTWTGEINLNDPYPKEFAVDYFRAYQPDGGYE